MTTHDTVREFYGKVADSEQQGCCTPTCCSTPQQDLSEMIGYTPEQLAAIPEMSNLGLGCGNPTAIAALEAGQTVLDLGSGAGIDCFLAAARVGAEGRVIGVDMTPSMISRARKTLAGSDLDNVEFRLGEIEHLPVADDTVDVVISNCVVNLAPDKSAVFVDVFRVLAPGGRLVISDIVAIAPIPDRIRQDAAALVGCVGNTEHVDRIREMLDAAGFIDVDVQVDPGSAKLVDEWFAGASQYVASASIRARKPE